MLKGQKIVIKLLMLSVLFLSGCSKSEKLNSDATLVNIVIQLTKKSKDDLYKLDLKPISIKEKLSKYYNFKYKGKPIYQVVKGYDSENDSIIYDDSLQQKKRMKFWSLKFKSIDSLFSKIEIENILKDTIASTFGNKGLINVKLIESQKDDSNSTFGVNRISKPYYGKDKNLAIVMHSFRNYSTFFIFKKGVSDWVLLKKIENL